MHTSCQALDQRLQRINFPLGVCHALTLNHFLAWSKTLPVVIDRICVFTYPVTASLPHRLCGASPIPRGVLRQRTSSESLDEAWGRHMPMMREAERTHEQCSAFCDGANYSFFSVPSANLFCREPAFGMRTGNHTQWPVIHPAFVEMQPDRENAAHDFWWRLRVRTSAFVVHGPKPAASLRSRTAIAAQPDLPRRRVPRLRSSQQQALILVFQCDKGHVRSMQLKNRHS
jgi:hypothetical protein